MANYSLILASSSKYRRELLDRLGLPYSCMSPDIDESALPAETPLALSIRLAEAKARAVAQKCPGSIVIGSDQVCVLNEKALGKPHTFERAFAQLREMSGNRAVFHSAVCVIDAAGNAHSFVCDTVITMRELTDEAITDYLNREKPFDCAGSAKIERLGIALMQSVTSDDPTSLIGLPLMKLTSVLTECGLPPVKGLML